MRTDTVSSSSVTLIHPRETKTTVCNAGRNLLFRTRFAQIMTRDSFGIVDFANVWLRLDFIVLANCTYVFVSD